MAKPVIDSYLKVDIMCWRREGMLEPGVNFTPRWGYGDGRAISLGVSVGIDHITLQHWSGSCRLVHLDWLQAGVRAWQPFFL